MSGKRIRQKACTAMGLLCALAVWVIVGCMDVGRIPVMRGAAAAFALELAAAALLWKAGVVRIG